MYLSATVKHVTGHSVNSFIDCITVSRNVKKCPVGHFLLLCRKKFVPLQIEKPSN